jgi:hypothetical protein
MADEPVIESRREQRREERLQQARGTVTPERVRVLPRDDEFRKTHRNIVGHANFPEQGSVEWPFDQYTKRRLRDGDIALEEAPAERREAASEPEPKQAKATRNQPPTPSTS